MKKKDETLVDSRLEKIGIVPSIYHFDEDIGPFKAITIVDNNKTWKDVRKSLEVILFFVLSTVPHEKATRLRKELCERGIYGVAICDGRDSFNRQRGRTIAKGRLWKHLKRMEK